MNVIDSAQLTKSTVNLCYEAIESVPMNDVGETLTLAIATTICCINCNEVRWASEGLSEENETNFSCMPINKKLTAFTFLLYQALYYFDIDQLNNAMKCIIEGLGLFGIESKKIIDLSNEISSLDMVYENARKFVYAQEMSLSKEIIND